MPSLPIQLPDDLFAFVDEQVKSGQFKSAGDFIVKMIDDARRTAAATSVLDSTAVELEAILLDSLDSGEPTPLDSNYFERLYAELLAKHGPAA